jgi:hypothetical protein
VDKEISRPTADIDAAWLKADLVGIEHAMQEYASEDETVISCRVQNTHPHPVTFTLEPWAEEVVMSPRSSVWVFACGPKGTEPRNKLHVQCGDDEITVFGWGGSLVYIVAVEE